MISLNLVTLIGAIGLLYKYRGRGGGYHDVIFTAIVHSSNKYSGFKINNSVLISLDRW